MIQLPDRLLGLMQRIEEGRTVTQSDVDRVAVLQALDIARAGEEFVRQTCQRDDAKTEAFRKFLEELDHGQ